jgi:hypothetical protein
MNSELNEKLSQVYGFNAITFANKSDYLLFVAQWKLAYKDLSRHLRQAKEWLKEVRRSTVNKQRLSKEDFAKLDREVKSYVFPTEIHGIKLPASNRWYEATNATALIALRYASKKVAGDQMRVARELKAS